MRNDSKSTEGKLIHATVPCAVMLHHSLVMTCQALEPDILPRTFIVFKNCVKPEQDP